MRRHGCLTEVRSARAAAAAAAGVFCCLDGCPCQGFLLEASRSAMGAFGTTSCDFFRAKLPLFLLALVLLLRVAPVLLTTDCGVKGESKGYA